MFEKIVLGTVQFGLPYGFASDFKQIPEEGVKEILMLAHQVGIKMLDTATTYGNCDKVLGKIDLVSDFKVVTKLAPLATFSGNITEKLNSIDRHFKNSLTNMKLETVDCLMVHHVKDLIAQNSRAYTDFLERQKIKGRTIRIGVSVYELKEIEQLLELPLSIDVIQVPASIADDRLERNGILKVLKGKDIEIHARSVFLQGILLMNTDRIPFSLAELRDYVLALDKACQLASASKLDACLAWGLNNRYIDKLVLGVSSPSDLSEIIESVIKYSEEKFVLPTGLPAIPETLLNPSNW